MASVYVLIEQPIGYGLFKIKHCQSTEDLIEILSNTDFIKLKKNFKLVEFQFFTSAENAAENCSAIAAGLVSADLETLLKKNLDQEEGILVVLDKKVSENFPKICPNIKLEFNSNVVFKLRKVRHFFHEFIDYTPEHLTSAHIGIGHGFSRVKLKYNENRSDNMIIQTINLLDHLDKVINKVSMRLREWFGYHYPELYKIVPDNKLYAKVVQLIKCRDGAVDEIKEQLDELVMDDLKVEQILETAKTSMGHELMEEDYRTIGTFTIDILEMVELRESTTAYLSMKMSQVAPNFSTLVGDIVSARLIAHAGSLMNLAKYPASTIQILGAEKALFRAIKARSNTPKYGLLFHSTFVGRAAKGDKGRISRFLAAKISLAVRLDFFSDEPINVYGVHLKRQVEEQLTYLSNGDEPRRTQEVMEVAVKEAKIKLAEMKLKRESEVPEPKKNKKRKRNDSADVEVTAKKIKAEEDVSVEAPKKKKKKSKVEEVVVEEKVIEIAETIPAVSQKKKKKSRKSAEQMEVDTKVEDTIMSEAPVEGKKKKKSKSEAAAPVVEVATVSSEPKMKKKKKSKNN